MARAHVTLLELQNFLACFHRDVEDLKWSTYQAAIAAVTTAVIRLLSQPQLIQRSKKLRRRCWLVLALEKNAYFQMFVCQKKYGSYRTTCGDTKLSMVMSG